MIISKKGNIFDSTADALVNPVNCVGVMGAGLALQFKKRYPINFEHYKRVCLHKQLRPGKMLVGRFDDSCVPNGTRLIINFPTKDHFRDNCQISYIKLGLENLIYVIKNHQIKSIAVPPLGCGLGGLNWDDVKPLIETAFAEFDDMTDMIVEIYEP